MGVRRILQPLSWTLWWQRLHNRHRFSRPPGCQGRCLLTPGGRGPHPTHFRCGPPGRSVGRDWRSVWLFPGRGVGSSPEDGGQHLCVTDVPDLLCGDGSPIRRRAFSHLLGGVGVPLKNSFRISSYFPVQRGHHVRVSMRAGIERDSVLASMVVNGGVGRRVSGGGTTVYTRMNRWSKNGVLEGCSNSCSGNRSFGFVWRRSVWTAP